MVRNLFVAPTFTPGSITVWYAVIASSFVGDGTAGGQDCYTNAEVRWQGVNWRKTCLVLSGTREICMHRISYYPNFTNRLLNLGLRRGRS